jgi:hypothetical protein
MQIFKAESLGATSTNPNPLIGDASDLLLEAGLDDLGSPLIVDEHTDSDGTHPAIPAQERQRRGRRDRLDDRARRSGEIMSQCPHTGFADIPLPNGDAIDGYIAQAMIFRKEGHPRPAPPTASAKLDLDGTVLPTASASTPTGPAPSTRPGTSSRYPCSSATTGSPT